MNKKNFTILTVMLLELLFPAYSIAQQHDINDEIIQNIRQQITNRFGVDYDLAIVEFDQAEGSSLYENRVQDPHDLMNETYIVMALGPRNTENQNKGFIGIYGNGEFLWVSPRIINRPDTGLANFYASRDLTGDGNLELIFTWKQGAKGRAGEVWIVSWDGTQGKIVNGLNDTGHESQVYVPHGHMWFADVNGDGVEEIQSYKFGDQEGYKTFSWNGQAFGSWSDTPQPGPSTFYPRDKLSISVKSFVTKKDGALHYQYILKNKENSKQGINEFYLLPQIKKLVIEHTSKHGWRFSDRNRTPFFFWSDWGMEQDEILAGETDSSFSYSTKALPFISRYYIQGANETPTDVSFEDIVEDIKTNSVSGYTLGPANPPDPFDASVFTDSLQSYTTRACQLEWITNRGVCNSLEKKLQNVKLQLERGNIRTVTNNVQAFLNEVEAVHRNHLTSEGYSLLYFNTEYLLKQLQEDINRGQ
ncbi:FIMAH domain-containing protein [Fodinibius saliphilus]|uniref:FIMAH domain-containing protein n=1 Tax=Fodinibius saliphilus TaxID=1920650 RepID=UPI0011089683|nr:hypothetical protein [Fodinibius saliphilus]